MRRAAAGVLVALTGLAADRRELAYAPAPPDNPLKGLVPYASAAPEERARFPHSLEFFYLPLSAVVVGPGRYDWAPLDRELDAVAGRGHQAVFRVHMEYPGQAGLIPKHLVAGGLKVHKYTNTNTAPLPPEPVETPDYADPNLRACLRDFIAALGARYDGDRRVGFLTAGLLGTWGEWHTYPRDDLAPSKAVQAEVLAAYEAAFARTPVLLRYPAGPADPAYAANAGRRFGYHDDSFAWATLPTGKPDDDWYFLNLLKKAGPRAVGKWKSHPVGGEVRPEAWGKAHDPVPGDPRIQDFAKCVAETHATWLMESGLFAADQPAGRKERAVAAVRRMGYEFHAAAVATDRKPDGTIEVRLDLVNKGVAPFYADWRPEYALLGPAGRPVKAWPGTGLLTGLLPGETRTWADRLDPAGVAPGTYALAVRVANPLPRGNPVRFANADQDKDAPGWLTLGTVGVP